MVTYLSKCEFCFNRLRFVIDFSHDLPLHKECQEKNRTVPFGAHGKNSPVFRMCQSRTNMNLFCCNIPEATNIKFILPKDPIVVKC